MNKKQLKSIFHNSKEKAVNVCILASLCTLPTAVHASSIETILNHTVRYLQGPVAKAAGIAAIVISGYMTLVMQKMPKEQFAMILVGMGIIFGGSSLYNTLIA